MVPRTHETALGRKSPLLDIDRRREAVDTKPVRRYTASSGKTRLTAVLDGGNPPSTG
jgi:hypothetical protein